MIIILGTKTTAKQHLFRLHNSLMKGISFESNISNHKRRNLCDYQQKTDFCVSIFYGFQQNFWLIKVRIKLLLLKIIIFKISTYLQKIIFFF